MGLGGHVGQQGHLLALTGDDAVLHIQLGQVQAPAHPLEEVGPQLHHVGDDIADGIQGTGGVAADVEGGGVGVAELHDGILVGHTGQIAGHLETGGGGTGADLRDGGVHEEGAVPLDAERQVL